MPPVSRVTDRQTARQRGREREVRIVNVSLRCAVRYHTLAPRLIPKTQSEWCRSGLATMPPVSRVTCANTSKTPKAQREWYLGPRKRVVTTLACMHAVCLESPNAQGMCVYTCMYVVRMESTSPYPPNPPRSLFISGTRSCGMRFRGAALGAAPRPRCSCI